MKTAVVIPAQLRAALSAYSDGFYGSTASREAEDQTRLAYAASVVLGVLVDRDIEGELPAAAAAGPVPLVMHQHGNPGGHDEVVGAARRFLAEAGTRDAFGHAQLGGVAPVVAEIVKSNLGYKYHWAVSDYLQRSARHIASKTDVDQAYAVGAAAVRMALQGKSGVMPVIERVSDEPYRWKIGEAQLSRVANREKMMPKGYISKDGFGITAAARRYLEPLIKGEDYPPYDRQGLPKYVTLQKKLVKKVLPDFDVS